MKEVRRQKDISYFRLESAAEADKLDIPEDEGGFDFFHGLGIIGYKQAFKMWLRRFPRPVLMVALKNNVVIGWAYLEEWSEVANDGLPVYVLRAIEVHPDFKRSGIGSMLLAISLKELNGYVLAKPLTKEGESFFRNFGFRSSEQFRKVPVDISKQPSYLILAPYLKDRMIRKLCKN